MRLILRLRHLRADGLRLILRLHLRAERTHRRLCSARRFLGGVLGVRGEFCARELRLHLGVRLGVHDLLLEVSHRAFARRRFRGDDRLEFRPGGLVRGDAIGGGGGELRLHLCDVPVHLSKRLLRLLRRRFHRVHELAFDRGVRLERLRLDGIESSVETLDGPRERRHARVHRRALFRDGRGDGGAVLVQFLKRLGGTRVRVRLQLLQRLVHPQQSVVQLGAEHLFLEFLRRDVPRGGLLERANVRFEPGPRLVERGGQIAMQRLRLVRPRRHLVAKTLAEFANRLRGGILQVRDVVLVRAAHGVVAAATFRSLLRHGGGDVVSESFETLVPCGGFLRHVRVVRVRHRQRKLLRVDHRALDLQRVRDVVRLHRGPQRGDGGVAIGDALRHVAVGAHASRHLGVNRGSEVLQREVHFRANPLDALLVAFGELAHLLAELALDHVRRARHLGSLYVQLVLERLRLHHRRRDVIIHLLLELLQQRLHLLLIVRRRLAHAVELDGVLRKFVEGGRHSRLRRVGAVAKAGLAVRSRSEHRSLELLSRRLVALILGLDDILQLLDRVGDVLRLDVIRLGVERLRDGGDGDVLLHRLERLHDVALEDVEVNLELRLPGVELAESRHLHLHPTLGGGETPGEFHLRGSKRLRRLDASRGEETLRLRLRLLHRRLDGAQRRQARANLSLEQLMDPVALLLELLSRLPVRLVELNHGLADLAAEFRLARLPRHLLVLDQRHHVVVHAVERLGHHVHLRDARGVLLPDRLLEHHLMLDVALALLLRTLLEGVHLVVLFADDVLIAKRRLLGLVHNLAAQLCHLILQVAFEPTQQRLLARVRRFLHACHRGFESSLCLRARLFLDHELLGHRPNRLLRRRHLGAHVRHLLHRAVRVTLTLHARDVRLQDLSLRAVFPARVRHVARQARDLRRELVEPASVGTLLDADALLNLVEGVARAHHRNLRRLLHAHRHRAILLDVRLGSLHATAELRHEGLGARRRLLHRVDAGLERVHLAPLPAQLLFPGSFGNRDATLEVSKTSRLRGILTLGHHETLLELAEVANVTAGTAGAAGAAARAGAGAASRTGGRAAGDGSGSREASVAFALVGGRSGAAHGGYDGAEAWENVEALVGLERRGAGLASSLFPSGRGVHLARQEEPGGSAARGRRRVDVELALHGESAAGRTSIRGSWCVGGSENGGSAPLAMRRLLATVGAKAREKNAIPDAGGLRWTGTHSASGSCREGYRSATGRRGIVVAPRVAGPGRARPGTAGRCCPWGSWRSVTKPRPPGGT